MVGIDLFENKRREIFSEKIIKRFFLESEINLILQSEHQTILASKIWSVKEAVYKLLHNLYPDLYFNKLAIEVSYVNFVFKVQYKKQNDISINKIVDEINWKNIFISDSDEKDYLIVIAIMK